MMQTNSTSSTRVGRRKRLIHFVSGIFIFASLYNTRGSIADSGSIVAPVQQQAEVDIISPTETTISLESSLSTASIDSKPMTVQATPPPPPPPPPVIPVETAPTILLAAKNGTREQGQNTDDAMTRAIVAICMGDKATQSTLVERFVWSARNKGEFKGYIVVLTNAPAERYAAIANWTDNFITIKPPEEHFSREHTHLEMARKRFKTYVLEYLNLDSRLNSVKLAYYLDVDIIFGSPIQRVFEGLEEKYQIGHAGIQESGSNKGLAKMWMFKGNIDKWSIQGGQMILDRATSQPCLDRWRWYMDRNLEELKDQMLLNMMVDDEKKLKKSALTCKIVAMDQENYIEFPEKLDMFKTAKKVKASANHTSGQKYSPLVHIRSTGEVSNAKRRFYELYVQDVLGMKKRKDVFGITSKQRLNQPPK